MGADCVHESYTLVRQDHLLRHVLAFARTSIDWKHQRAKQSEQRTAQQRTRTEQAFFDPFLSWIEPVCILEIGTFADILCGTVWHISIQ